MKSRLSLLARVVFAASLMSALPLFADEPESKSTDSKPCHWWQFGKCADNTEQIEGLPTDAPREGTVVTVDVAKNRIYLFENGELVDKSPVATGSEKVLKKAGKTFLFHTPRGRMKVLRKIQDPVWTKPDWAFIEDGEPIPPPDSPKRLVKGHLAGLETRGVNVGEIAGRRDLSGHGDGHLAPKRRYDC